MILVIDDTKFHITWRHLKDLDMHPGQTECIISTIDEKGDRHPIAEADAFCSVLDNYSKNKGRKISLTRALKKTNMSVEARRLVWNMYAQMRGGKY